MNSLSPIPLSAIIFIGSLFLMRMLYNSVKSAKKHPWWVRILSGVFAWCFSLSILTWFGDALVLTIEFFMGKHNDITFVFYIYLYLVINLLIFKWMRVVPEQWEWNNLMSFIAQSLLFETYCRDREDLRFKLERFFIRKIHRETTGNPFPEMQNDEETELFEHLEKKKTELQQHTVPKPVTVSVRTALNQLQRNETADMLESWTLATMTDRSAPFEYQHIIEAQLSPASNTLSLKLSLEGVHPEHFTHHASFLRLKQMLYEFLHRAYFEHWIRPFRPYFSTIELIMYGTKQDDHGIYVSYPCIRVSIAVSELQKREDVIFSGGDLHTIASITAKNGEPIK